MHTRVCGGQNTAAAGVSSLPHRLDPRGQTQVLSLAALTCGAPHQPLSCFGFAVQGTQSRHACHAGYLAVSCFGANSLYTLKLSCTGMIGMAWDSYPLLGDADTAV